MLKRAILCAALILVIASAVSAGERTLESYMELMRSDLRTAKIAIITDVMQFTRFPPGVHIKRFPTSEFPSNACPKKKEPSCHFLVESASECFYSCPLMN